MPENPQPTRRDVVIRAPVARADARAKVPLGAMQHHCPFCRQTFAFLEFVEHAPACIAAHPDEVRDILERGK